MNSIKKRNSCFHPTFLQLFVTELYVADVLKKDYPDPSVNKDLLFDLLGKWTIFNKPWRLWQIKCVAIVTRFQTNDVYENRVHDSSQSWAAFIPAKLMISRISQIFRDLLSCKANFIINVLLCVWGQFPSTSPRGLIFGEPYTWSGLFSEFYGIFLKSFFLFTCIC